MSTKIYLDYFFGQIFKNHHIQIENYCQFNLTNWIDKLPNDCDIIGVSFYTNDYWKYNNVINDMLKKTKKLLINISEPTNNNLLNFIDSAKNPKIKFYTDIVTNDKCNDFETVVSWFIESKNYYADYAWARELMSNIKMPRSWEPRDKIFDCLLGSEKKHRDTIEKLYFNSDYKDKIIFSYFKKDPKNGIWTSNNNLNNFDVNIQTPTGAVSRYALLPCDIYNQSYFSIVAETTAFNNFSQFTEKVAKPILARRPFIAFCGQYYLKNLRQLGFKTFGDVFTAEGSIVIDESYDNEPNENLRMQMAWQQVEKLCKSDPIFVYSCLNNILDYNLMHFIKTNWHQAIYNELQKEL